MRWGDYLGLYMKHAGYPGMYIRHSGYLGLYMRHAGYLAMHTSNDSGTVLVRVLRDQILFWPLFL